MPQKSDHDRIGEIEGRTSSMREDAKSERIHADYLSDQEMSRYNELMSELRTEAKQDHDILIELRTEVKGMRAMIEELATGRTANCAREQSRMENLEAQVKILFAEKTNKQTFVIISGIWLALYGGILAAVLIALNK